MKFDKFESTLNDGKLGLLKLLSSRNLSEYQITVLIGSVFAQEEDSLIRLLLDNSHIRLTDTHYISIIKIIAINVIEKEKEHGFKTNVFSSAFSLISPIRRVKNIQMLVDFYSQLDEEQRKTDASIWIFQQIINKINIFYRKKR